MNTAWSDEDALAAQAEGWGIFDCGGDHEPFELQRIDFPNGCDNPVFDNDEGAWEHVVTRAETGSALHLRALTFLANESAGEIVHIAFRRSIYGGPCPCSSCDAQD